MQQRRGEFEPNPSPNAARKGKAEDLEPKLGPKLARNSDSDAVIFEPDRSPNTASNGETPTFGAVCPPNARDEF